MTFNAYETSNEDGRPVTLYKFVLGNLHWEYTSADRDIEYPAVDGDTYRAIAISDEGITQSQDATNDSLSVTIEADTEVTSLFQGTPPSSSLWLTVRQVHYDDGDLEAPVVWIGTVGGVIRKSASQSTISAQTLGKSLERGGLRLLWNRQCPHMLFGPGCTLNKADFAVPTTIEDISGLTLRSADISGFDVGYFDGGFFEWDRGAGTMERRGLRAGGTTDTVQLLTSSDGLSAGMNITLYPGCDRTIPTCDSKFSNSDNYGGIPGLPGKSPFSATPIF